jgi:acyl carrier protein
LTDEQIKDRIRDIIAAVTGIDRSRITDTASFTDDLKLDSLSQLEIVVTADEEFALRLPNEDLKGLDNLEETMALIRRHLKASGAEGGAA